MTAVKTSRELRDCYRATTLNGYNSSYKFKYTFVVCAWRHCYND